MTEVETKSVTIYIDTVADELTLEEQAFVRAQKKRAIRGLRAWLSSLVPNYQGELSVLFCSNETSRRLNREYRGKDSPTDVLSFGLLEQLYRGEGWQASDLAEPLGDIVVNITQLFHQHAEWDNSAESELGRLLAHGLLHLLGFDHELGYEEEKAMHKKENELALIWKNFDSRR